MQITFVQCHSQGPAGYRVQAPARLLRDRGHSVRIKHATQPKQGWSPSMFVGDDVVVIQRQHDANWIEMLRQVPRLAIVVEFDDPLWMLLGKELPPDVKQGFIRMMRGADGVTCSTPELATHASKHNASVAFIPNALDLDGPRDWVNRPTSRPTGKLVIGWAGSLRGDDDFLVMGDALRRVLCEYHNACFAIGGDEQENAKHCQALGLPEEQVFILPPSDFQSYPQMVGLFDIGLAPLSDHPANACKSELKLMEYGAWGIPYVASEVAPYRRFHSATGKVGGFLAQTPNQWYLSLRCLLEDEERRQVMGADLRPVTRSLYSEALTGELWERALEAAVERARAVEGS